MHAFGVPSRHPIGPCRAGDTPRDGPPKTMLAPGASATGIDALSGRADPRDQGPERGAGPHCAGAGTCRLVVGAGASGPPHTSVPTTPVWNAVYAPGTAGTCWALPCPATPG